MTGDVKPWGVFATFVFGGLALLAGQLSGIAALTSLYELSPAQVATATQDGGAIVLFIFISAPVQVTVLMIAAGYRSNAAAYLGYKIPRQSEVVFGVAVLVALIALGDAVSWLAGRNIVDRFQTDIYQAAESANLLPLLLVAITVFIPVTEESLFRGFLFRGWLRSPRYAWPVIVFICGLVCRDPRSVRLVSYRAGVCLRCLVWVDTMGDRLDDSDHTSSCPGQSGRHDRNCIESEQLTGFGGTGLFKATQRCGRSRSDDRSGRQARQTNNSRRTGETRNTCNGIV